MWFGFLFNGLWAVALFGFSFYFVSKGYEAMDLVLIGFDGWTTWERRPQLLSRALAKQGIKILYVAPGPSSRTLIKTGVQKPSHLLNGYLRKIEENLFVYHCGMRWSMDRSLLGNSISMAIEELYIKRAMRKIGMIRPVLGYQAPFNRVFLNSSGFALKFYDCIDEWSAFPNTNEWLVSHIEEQILNASDVICCTAKSLINTKRCGEKPVYYLPNAVGEAFFRSSPQNEKCNNEEIILGYVGGFGGDHFDYEVVRGILRLKTIAGRPYRIHLVGPIIDHFNNDQISVLASDSRVTIAGRVNYNDMPSVMHTFDYSILPWRITPLVENVDPIKVYEYLAIGSPIISAHWNELDRFGSLIYFTDAVDGYVAAIEKEERKSLEQKSAERHERISVARKHTWDARAKELKNILERALKRED